MGTLRAVLALAAATPILTLSGVALAGKADHRVFGIGTALGGGVTSDSLGVNLDEPIPDDLQYAIELPTLELQGFLHNEWSFDVTIPVGNIIAVKAATDVLVWRTDVFFNFNFGEDYVRFILGPGIGFGIVAGASYETGSIRFPGEIGLELNNRKEAFGFKLMARPWVEFVPQDGDPVGGGVMGLVGFSGYVVD